jgi:hypothetical protein
MVQKLVSTNALFLDVQFDRLLRGRDLMPSLGVAQADDFAKEIDLGLVHPPEFASHASELDGDAMDRLRHYGGDLTFVFLQSVIKEDPRQHHRRYIVRETLEGGGQSGIADAALDDFAEAFAFVFRQGLKRDETSDPNGEPVFMGKTTGQGGGCAAREGLLRDLHLPVMGAYDDVVFSDGEEAQSCRIFRDFGRFVVVAAACHQKDVSVVRSQPMTVISNDEVAVFKDEPDVLGFGAPRVLDHLVDDAVLGVAEELIRPGDELAAEGGFNGSGGERVHCKCLGIARER